MELQPILVVLLLLAALGIASLSIQRFLSRRQFARRHRCQPVARCSSKDPFLGLDTIPGTIRAIRGHRILQRGCELFSEYGNTFRVKELHRSAILTIEPENIKTILSLRFADYGISHRLKPFKPLLGEGIFNTDGEHWASSRALIRPSFAREQVADLRLLEGLIQKLFVLLPRDSSTVDLQELFFLYTLDSATEFLFGQSFGMLKKRKSTVESGTFKRSTGEPGFAEAFHYSQKAVLTRSMLGPLSALYRDRKADDCNRICRGFAQQFVEEAVYAAAAKKGEGEEDMEKKGKQKHIFSHELASRTSDQRRILDELMNVLLAGRDTTASLLSNLFFVLAKNPRIWKKLRDEVSVLQGQPPTYEQLRRLKYIQYCVNESLRLHPVVPRNEREAIRDTVLPLGGGKDGLSPVFVPKGTLAAYNVYAMHRRADLYGPDAEEFRPERWEDGTLQPRWGYLPFNGGPRICIGQRYALTEVSYILVRMVQEFRRLESRDPGPWEESLALTLCSRNGTKVGLIP
ncbi:cytochrome P450 [Aspergillus leporis]|uniref:Cytochrome P450 n=1 Tax=Aspergillus leporis TaxID=41062 RepID=A0A5N5WN56_9EURO|nr:cytochrome P450 [Aspergillus leporis]